MLKRIVTTLGVVMFMIAMAGTQASAQNGSATKVSGRASGQSTFFDSCTGEWITMNINIFVSGTLVNNGQTSRVQVHVDLSGDGTGTPSGTTYSLQSLEDGSGDVAPDAAGNYNETLTSDLVLISHGSAPNELLHLVEHILITPSQNVEIRYDIATNCRG
jgi:hypothetical protein